MSTEQPNPGSPEAVAAGCRCPRLDNRHGRGGDGHGGHYTIRVDCPMHGFSIPETLTPQEEQ